MRQDILRTPSSTSPRWKGSSFEALTAAALLAVACSGASAPTPTPTPTSRPTVAVTASPNPTPSLATASPSEYPLTVVDDEGTALTLAAEPERVVSLTPATTELLFALGDGEKLVGRTDFDDYPPEAVDSRHPAIA